MLAHTEAILQKFIQLCKFNDIPGKYHSYHDFIRRSPTALYNQDNIYYVL